MGLVIATFIITAVFVGYHASQESDQMAEGHNELMELMFLSNHANHTIHTFHNVDHTK
jgi:hypothetical protein